MVWKEFFLGITASFDNLKQMKEARRSRLKKRHSSGWTLAELKHLGKVHDSVLARRTGRTIKEVVAERESRRIRLPIARRWTMREIRLLGTMNDHELARRLRRSVNAVHGRRAALNIAPFKPRPKLHPLYFALKTKEKTR